MEYHVTARKWRPQTFAEVIGQEHVTRALRNAISSHKIPHAYLFSGSRGVGKTTTARILAKALNCETGLTIDPCGKCNLCKDIMNGNSLDVQEIDGASNRGIDEIRKVRDNVVYLPLVARYKVYIIDEVHMLTKEASNALLKTLEEPPDHVIFILATTEPHNVISTIRSRCQHYIFKRISTNEIIKQLKKIAQDENIKTTDDGLFVIASAAEGSMRDAQSIFDQVVLYTDGNITEASAMEVVGLPDEVYFKNIVDAMLSNNIVSMLQTVNQYIENVGNIKLFTRGFVGYFRNGLLVKNVEMDHELIDITEARYNNMKQLFSSFSDKEIIQIINQLSDLFRQLRGDAQEKFLLESAMFKLMDYKNIVPLSELRNEIMKIVSKGGVVQAMPTPIHTQNIAHTASPVQQQKAIETQPTAYHKLDIQPSNTPSQEPTTTSSSQVSVEEAFYQVISKSALLNTIKSKIIAVNIKNENIDVTLIDNLAFETFEAKREDIETAISKMLKQPVALNCIKQKIDISTPTQNPNIRIEPMNPPIPTDTPTPPPTDTPTPTPPPPTPFPVEEESNIEDEAYEMSSPTDTNEEEESITKYTMDLFDGSPG